MMTYRTAQNKVRQVRAHVATARSHYEQVDTLIAELRERFGIGQPIKTRQGTFVIVDNFPEGKDSAYKPARFSRYELKEMPKGKRGA